MAYKIGSTTLIHNSGVIFDHQTEIPYASIAGTEIKITPASGSTTVQDYFGYSVAVGNNRIVVGAYGDDDVENGSGAAYIFDLDGNQLAKIKPSDPGVNDYFGYSVAVGNGRIVVGSRYDDDVVETSGSAYIYDLEGNFIKKINGHGGGTDNNVKTFGNSVAVDNGRIVVGAVLDSTDGTSSGAAYIFDLDGVQLAKIRPPLFSGYGERSLQYFGTQVAVGNGRIVVGATGYHNGVEDVPGLRQGSAYVYDLDGNLLKHIIPPTTPGDIKGYSAVAVSCGRIVIGANGYESGDYDEASVLYDLNGNYIKTIATQIAVNNNNYGAAVSIGSGIIAVGAPRDDNNIVDRLYMGSVRIYDLDGNLKDKIEANDQADRDQFGYSVAVGSGRIVVGTPFDDDNGSSTGSAYIYNLGDSQDTTFEQMLAGYGKE